MPVATDVQMQNFADGRLRPRSEQIRNLHAAVLDDISVIDDIYARGVSEDRWDDNRTDGPPHLLQSGDSANPDDMLNYNTALVMFNKFMTGTFADVNEANSFAANWAVLRDACVRPLVD